MFRPSHQSLLVQNAEIDRMELPRIQDDAELEHLKADRSSGADSHQRVAAFRSAARSFATVLPSMDTRLYRRRWSSLLPSLSSTDSGEFGRAYGEGAEKASPPQSQCGPCRRRYGFFASAGVTVDLQRRGMTNEQISWMEHYLFYMKALGLVEPEEERHQWVFHIMVSGHYSEWRETQNIVPVEHQDDEKPPTQVALGAAGTK